MLSMGPGSSTHSSPTRDPLHGILGLHPNLGLPITHFNPHCPTPPPGLGSSRSATKYVPAHSTKSTAYVLDTPTHGTLAPPPIHPPPQPIELSTQPGQANPWAAPPLPEAPPLTACPTAPGSTPFWAPAPPRLLQGLQAPLGRPFRTVVHSGPKLTKPSLPGLPNCLTRRALSPGLRPGAQRPAALLRSVCPPPRHRPLIRLCLTGRTFE